MFTDKQIEDIINILCELDDNTKVYFGCDSVRFMRKDQQYARYATVFIIHKNGKNGCCVFSNISSERNYDLKQNRPKMRMMTEAKKVCELYLQLIPFLDESAVEIHLDISMDPKFGSNCAASEAAGYVLGMTGLDPDRIKLKPDSMASSFGADWAVHQN